jgi:hypothetical protein
MAPFRRSPTVQTNEPEKGRTRCGCVHSSAAEFEATGELFDADAAWLGDASPRGRRGWSRRSTSAFLLSPAFSRRQSSFPFQREKRRRKLA